MYELVANVWKLQDFIHRCEFLASLEEFGCSIALMALSPAVTSFTWGRKLFTLDLLISAIFPPTLPDIWL